MTSVSVTNNAGKADCREKGCKRDVKTFRKCASYDAFESALQNMCASNNAFFLLALEWIISDFATFFWVNGSFLLGSFYWFYSESCIIRYNEFGGMFFRKI